MLYALIVMAYTSHAPVECKTTKDFKTWTTATCPGFETLDVQYPGKLFATKAACEKARDRINAPTIAYVVNCVPVAAKVAR